jgi:hypothetical protein
MCVKTLLFAKKYFGIHEIPRLFISLVKKNHEKNFFSSLFFYTRAAFTGTESLFLTQVVIFCGKVGSNLKQGNG